MFSDLFYQLVEQGVLVRGIWETVYMTLLSTVIAYGIGLPLGILLNVTGKSGLHPVRWLNAAVGFVVNIFRSIPFIILMIAMLPVAKVLVGTSLGNKAMIVMLIIAAAPYVARMVESSLQEIKPGVIEAAQAMGASDSVIIWRVMLPEAMPSLITGAVISTVTILGYSAMAGTISAGGLGQIAVNYGYQRTNNDIIWVCVVLTVIIVQIIQSFGMRLAHRLDRRIKHGTSRRAASVKIENRLNPLSAAREDPRT